MGEMTVIKIGKKVYNGTNTCNNKKNKIEILQRKKIAEKSNDLLNRK